MAGAGSSSSTAGRPRPPPIHKICAAEDEAPHPRRRGRPTERHGPGIGDGGAFFFRDATEGGAEMYDCHDALERATHRISIAQVAQGNFDAELAQWLGAPEITHENAYGRIVTYQARHESTSEAAGGPCHENGHAGTLAREALMRQIVRVLKLTMRLGMLGACRDQRRERSGDVAGFVRPGARPPRAAPRANCRIGDHAR